ncbi:outer membrane protein [Novosphingobium panipatense]|uniref:Porin family protein n=1 Tax=Sphingobium yanoikuyae TaxID=13690 RepID=A0A3G2UP73_SPHYA|nr:outer membrane beta-barrel protein [Sphingobium yanoikuyae]AYO75878.1 porin family protein [Sphingobium yanoikuyae]MDG2515818.1 outer membrane beta-barrel protein [Sphingobium yanoikuyae]
MKKFAIASAALSSTALVFAVAIATPAAAQEFQGPYVGAQVGWKQDKAINDSRNSVVGGVLAGYDQEVTPNVVLGVEAGFSLAASDRIGPAGTNAAVIDPDYSFDVSARAGYVVGQKNLLYVRGGYANSRGDFVRNIGSVRVSDKETYDGWFVGGGVERKLLDNVSTRIEYRYSDLGSNNFKFDRHQVLAGVAYRF